MILINDNLPPHVSTLEPSKTEKWSASQIGSEGAGQVWGDDGLLIINGDYQWFVDYQWQFIKVARLAGRGRGRSEMMIIYWLLMVIINDLLIINDNLSQLPDWQGGGGVGLRRSWMIDYQ